MFFGWSKIQGLQTNKNIGWGWGIGGAKESTAIGVWG
jgi:hypothetical protein